METQVPLRVSLRPHRKLLFLLNLRDDCDKYVPSLNHLKEGDRKKGFVIYHKGSLPMLKEVHEKENFNDHFDFR